MLERYLGDPIRQVVGRVHEAELSLWVGWNASGVIVEFGRHAVNRGRGAYTHRLLDARAFEGFINGIPFRASRRSDVRGIRADNLQPVEYIVQRGRRNHGNTGNTAYVITESEVLFPLVRKVTVPQGKDPYVYQIGKPGELLIQADAVYLREVVKALCSPSTRPCEFPISYGKVGEPVHILD